MPRFKAPFIPSSEITPQSIYLRRRDILGITATGLALAAAPQAFAAPLTAKPTDYKVPDELTPKEDVTTYNNFYEFGTDKADPARQFGQRSSRGPGPIKVDGLVGKPQTFDIEDLIKATTDGRARLPDALRRGLVDGDSVGSAFRCPRCSTRSSRLGAAKYVAFETAGPT